MGVSRCMLLRGNFMCHSSSVWAHPCFREETLCAIHHGCEQMHASERKLYVSFIISVSTPMLQRENFMCHSSSVWAHPCFREETLYAIHHGCEQMHVSGRKLYVPFIISVSTPMLQRGNFMCHTSWVWADACFREKTWCAIHHQCEHTHASERELFVPYITWVWADACFREETLYAIHHGCEQMHASGRKLYVPFIISVSAPITSENKCVMLHIVGLESPKHFQGAVLLFYINTCNTLWM